MAGQFASAGLDVGQPARKTAVTLATSLDVAQATGVSRATVSRCFTPGSSVRQGTRVRVLRAAQALGYEPNLLARMLNKQESNIVAVVTADFHNPFQPALMEALVERLRASGLVPLLLKAGHVDEPADELMQLAMSYRVSAIIVTVVAASPAMIRRCVESGTPVLFLNRVPEDTVAVSVCADVEQGAARLAEVLVEAGRTRIGMITGRTGTWTNAARRGGFRQRLDMLGFDLVGLEPGDFTYEGGRRAAAALLAKSPRLNAIYACNDTMAFGALDAIRLTAGRSVPDDIAVVGFDDVPISDWDGFKLSTFRQPIGELVDHACAILARPDRGLDLAGQTFFHACTFVQRLTTPAIHLAVGEIDRSAAL